jgi:hypothetical protein
MQGQMSGKMPNNVTKRSSLAFRLRAVCLSVRDMGFALVCVNAQAFCLNNDSYQFVHW